MSLRVSAMMSNIGSAKTLQIVPGKAYNQMNKVAREGDGKIESTESDFQLLASA